MEEKPLKQKVKLVIEQTKHVTQRPNAPGFLPYILSWLEEVAEELEKPEPEKERLLRLASALGRGITDDYEFSESPLGTKLLETISDIVRQCDSRLQV